LCGTHRSDTAGCGDRGNPTMNQVGCKRWKLVVATFRPSVLDDYVATFNKSDFSNTIAEGGRTLS
jgi:hypothetical protein